MHGFANGIDFVAELLCDNSIICIQESWPRPFEINQLRPFEINRFNEFVRLPFLHQSYSGMNEFDYGLGRPFGGLSVIYDSNCLKLVCDYGVSFNKRVMGLMFSLGDQLILVFNVYLPCFCDTVEYLNDINIICGFMDSVLFSNEDKKFYTLICGDFNADTTKMNNSASLAGFKGFIERHSLQNTNIMYGGSDNIDYTYFCVSRNVSSWIDHIFACSGLLSMCDEYNYDIIDSSVNYSDHLCVNCCFKLKTVMSDQCMGNKKVNDNTCINTISKYV
jgi:hypothetical protein